MHVVGRCPSACKVGNGTLFTSQERNAGTVLTALPDAREAAILLQSETKVTSKFAQTEVKVTQVHRCQRKPAYTYVRMLSREKNPNHRHGKHCNGHVYHRGVFSMSRLSGDLSPDFFRGGASVMVVFWRLWMVMERLRTSSCMEASTVTTVDSAFWFSDITCTKTERSGEFENMQNKEQAFQRVLELPLRYNSRNFRRESSRRPCKFFQQGRVVLEYQHHRMPNFLVTELSFSAANNPCRYFLSSWVLLATRSTDNTSPPTFVLFCSLSGP